VEAVGFGVGVSIDGVGVQVFVSVGSDASPGVTESNVVSSMPQAEQNLAARAISVPHLPQNLVCGGSAICPQPSCLVDTTERIRRNSSCRQFSVLKLEQLNMERKTGFEPVTFSVARRRA